MAQGFKSELLVGLVDDLANDGRGEWMLLQDLVYESLSGQVFTVPKFFSCDFASVPRAPFAFWLTGDTAHRAAVIHDYLCRTTIVKRRIADDIFYEIMQYIGMPKWRAKVMHLAVRSYSVSL